MLSVFGFMIILGPLVIFHEFGHYIFARIFNVKAEIFSVGFGPKIWGKKIGETEWRFSAFPLGGYVKLLGEEGDTKLSPEDEARALQRQAPWKRFFIFFGGPLFNFILAVFIFMIILAIGEPQLASVVGRVARGSIAEKAGFKSGDRVISVGGTFVHRYDEMSSRIAEHPGQSLDFEIQRPGEKQTLRLIATPEKMPGYSMYGEATEVGEIAGMYPNARSTQVGVSNLESAVGKAGLRSGDSIREWNGTPVQSFEQIETLYRSAVAGASITLKWEKAQGKGQFAMATFEKPKNAPVTPGEAWGLHSSELFVDKTIAKSPAEVAGVKAGDRVVAVGGKKIQSFYELKENVQLSGEKEGKVVIEWEREGKLMSTQIVPSTTTQRDPMLKKTTQFTVGLVPQLTFAEPDVVVDRIWNPFVLLYKGTERVVSFSVRNLVSIVKMFTGEVSVATLGGPILIGKIAGESLSRGLISFLTTMGILSIGLGVLNLLPVPVLDGGHLVLLGIESIRGRPLSLRQMEIVQQVGLSLILLLMIVVIKNDLTRLPIFNN